MKTAQIKLTFEVRNTDKERKIEPLKGEITGGFRKDKKNPKNNIFVLADTIESCLGFLLSHVHTLNLKQFSRKHVEFFINDVEMPSKVLFYDMLTAQAEFKNTLAMLGGLLSISDDTLGDRWAREHNTGAVKIGKAKLDGQDIAAISKQIVSKEKFLSSVRGKYAKGYVWSDEEKALLEKQREYNKAMRIANKETKQISK